MPEQTGSSGAAAAEAEEVVTVVVEMVASLAVEVVVARRSILMTNTLGVMEPEAKSGFGHIR